MMETFFGPRLLHHWPARRPDLHWHILPPPAAAARLTDAYAALTDRAGLAAVDAAWLHCTLLHSAPVAVVSDAHRADIIAAVRDICTRITPWQMTVERPVPGPVAIEAAITPGQPARQLCRLITDVTYQVAGFDPGTPHPADGYYPHMSLAYATDDVPDRDLRVWLSDNPIPHTTFTVDEIALVAQSHDGHKITWQPITTIPLGGTTAPHDTTTPGRTNVQ
ncbi:hypothetical protein J2S43_001063 [Catenuloplanes nepalensis]|uniref:2'-5' RNA ligase family protein n=1 Tax=Catenuloplanes nepalensis TaxID=587533 RepID=A0ABT9MM94_9ACTN|nr:2'-5' RNA ligase family protein [Catenuloplanes nepalensis]MDP9792551.1 hypothetical protein [Catenuloplanes nepalensis]